MSITVKFDTKISKPASTYVCLVDSKKTLCGPLKKLDQSLHGFIKDAIANSPQFKAKAQDTLWLPLPKGAGYTRLLLVSSGESKNVTALEAEKTGAKIYQMLAANQVNKADICLCDHPFEEAVYAAHLAHGAVLKSYCYDKYRPKGEGQASEETVPPAKMEILLCTEAAPKAKKSYHDLAAISEGVFMARDLVNEAPNVLYPESYAEIIKKELTPLGVKVEILDETKMAKLGMGAILAVGMGSARPPRMVIMRWNGAEGKSKTPLGFIGKGVTFDTGGISLKPGAGMDEMKMDMGGSAAVVGLMKSLALQKVKKDVVAIVGLAENMPSDRAYRPGDIIKSYSGKYIEVLNTDAEGRLVLVDCISYMQEKYDPAFIIDLATLTGAMMVALAHEYTGVFANDDKLWGEMDKAGNETGEKLWRMPLDEAYRKDVESDIGDVRNLAKNGRYGGACTAAAFLEHFIDKKRKWAHMDIAGTAWLKSDTSLGPKGATGIGVRVLNRFVQSYK